MNYTHRHTDTHADFWGEYNEGRFELGYSGHTYIPGWWSYGGFA